MKITRLDLKAFGPFTDLTLDLSAGREGFHVIYGPNEAGKSTTLRAIEQALFGIPTRSTDDFLHSYQNLRIGATLAGGGVQLAFLRRKGARNTLLAADGDTPLDEAALRPLLGGLDRELFATMFGIDHAQLIRGGREIVEGSGNVGQVLFAAGAGIADLQAVQERLRKDAEGLFTPRSSARPINQMLRTLDEAKRKVRQTQLPSEHWVQHDQALREARLARERLETELAQLKREEARLTRIGQALPLIAKRQGLLGRRAGMPPVVRLRSDFAEQRRTISSQLQVAEAREHADREELERIEAQLQAISLPDVLLARADEIQTLPEALGSYRKAQRDLPRLRLELDQLRSAAAAKLRDIRPGLSLEMVDTLRLSTAQQVALRDMAGRYEALRQSGQQAREEIDETQQQLDEEQRELAALPPEGDAAALKDAVRRAQGQGDLEAVLAAAAAELGRLQKQAQTMLRRLPYWAGTLEQLEQLAVPSLETVGRFEKELGEADQESRRSAEKRETARAALADCDRQLNECRLAGEVPSEAELLRARRLRDQGWQLVLDEWQGRGIDPPRLEEFLGHFSPGLDLAAAYPRAVAAADVCADRLRREAQRVAQQAGLLATQISLQGQMADAEAQEQVARQNTAAVQAAWQAAWPLPAPAAPSPALGSPREMRSWLDQHRVLLQLAEAVRKQQTTIDELRQRIALHAEQLNRCLADIGESGSQQPAPLAALLGRCQALVERTEAAQAERQNRQKNVRLLTARLKAAQAKARQADDELHAWQDRWALAVEPLGLPPDAVPAQANAVLGQLGELFTLLHDARRIQERIEGIGSEAQQFHEQVQRLMPPAPAATAAAAGGDTPAAAVDAVAEDLVRRVQKAVVDQQRQQALLKEQQRKQAACQAAHDKLADLSARLRVLCDEAGCADPAALPEVERRWAEAAQLERELAELEDHLMRLSGGAPLEHLAAEAEAVNSDELPGRIEHLAGQIQQLEAQRQELSEKIGGEEKTLQSMQASSTAVEAAEEVQDVLARLESGVAQYARLRLAAAVLRQGIERYRRKNEGPVLRRASELFCRFTLGRFQRLSADCDEQGQKILQGVRADGRGPVALSGMSEGTADQLYLALRLASLESYFEGREPFPLIVDDILISFDDRRAAAALTALAELSGRTQIIFFTHHGHLVELARQSVPEETLIMHELAPAA